MIERKTLDDFVKWIYDGRLFKQLVNMNEKYAKPIVIIQGEKKRLSGIGESAFYGALASVLADFKVPIFFASDEKEVSGAEFSTSQEESRWKRKETPESEKAESLQALRIIRGTLSRESRESVESLPIGS